MLNQYNRSFATALAYADYSKAGTDWEKACETALTQEWSAVWQCAINSGRAVHIARQRTKAYGIAFQHSEASGNVAPYHKVVRHYQRAIQGNYGGAPITQTVAVEAIGGVDTTDPSDWPLIACPIGKKEKEHNQNHARADSRYANRRMRNVTAECFDARQSEKVAEWLARCSEETKSEIVSLLESPLNPVSPDYETMPTDTVWQAHGDTHLINTRSGMPPRVSRTDWNQIADVPRIWIRKLAHWHKVGDAKHGDDVWTINATKFAEWSHNWALKYGNSLLVPFLRDRPIKVMAPKAKRAGASSASERVARARERMRAKRAAKRAQQASE